MTEWEGAVKAAEVSNVVSASDGAVNAAEVSNIVVIYITCESEDFAMASQCGDVIRSKGLIGFVLLDRSL